MDHGQVPGLLVQGSGLHNNADSDTATVAVFPSAVTPSNPHLTCEMEEVG